MSRIFDALQRLESEQSGADTDTSALPQSTELLRRAEKRAASTWEAKATVSDHAPGRGGILLEEMMHLGNAAPALSLEQRLAVLDKFPNLPISLPTDSHLVCLTDRENPTAEAVRLLGVRLRDFRRTRALKKILITSTIPREGKSTISANLACALGHGSEEKVLVIEGDVRLPTVLSAFGGQRVPGLCDLLQEDGELLNNIYHLDGAGVWILPAGKETNNPLELLQSQRLPQLLDRLVEVFDWIIIDSPPVLPLADTSVWMRLADGVLLVTRQGVTEKRQLQKGLEALEPEKVLGALLNGTSASAYSGYYYRTQKSS